MSWQRFVIGFDPHGIQQDEKANKAFFKFVAHWKPEIRVAGGDIFDFSQLRKGADSHEKRDSMSADVSAGLVWLRTLRATHYLRGNHCERLWDLAAQGEGIVADYAHEGVGKLEAEVRKLRCQMYPYNKREGVMKLGSLKVIHGYSSGLYAARTTAQVYGSVTMGHGHGIQMQPIAGLEQRTGFMGGCLCKKELGYNRAQMGTLMWEHGWQYGVVNHKTGNFQLWQARELDGQWLLPTGIETL